MGGGFQKFTTEKTVGISSMCPSHAEPMKASFVRQISEDCERARSSFRPSEVSPLGLGDFFSRGDILPRTTQTQKVVNHHIFPKQPISEKKKHLIFLGGEKPNYLLSLYIYI